MARPTSFTRSSGKAGAQWAVFSTPGLPLQTVRTLDPENASLATDAAVLTAWSGSGAKAVNASTARAGSVSRPIPSSTASCPVPSTAPAAASA